MTTTRSDRRGISQRIRWCSEAETWQPEDDAICGWLHWEGSHRLRIRRALVCSVCDQAYFTKGFTPSSVEIVPVSTVIISSYRRHTPEIADSARVQATSLVPCGRS